MSIEKTIFGTTKDGREVTAYTLRNIRGMRAEDQQSRSGNRIRGDERFCGRAQGYCAWI